MSTLDIAPSCCAMAITTCDACIELWHSVGVGADLVAAEAVLKAVAGVHAPAKPCPDSAGPALALQGRGTADPVLNQQAHASPWVMPPLLQRRHIALHACSS